MITEDRLLTREKYSQAKLLANFIQVSPTYLSAVPQNNSNANGSYTGSPAIATTALFGTEHQTNFYVVRHAAYNSLDVTSYNITLPTSKGNFTIPQLGGELSLHGRDSKVYVTDYNVGGFGLLYSTAEIFTWRRYHDGSQKSGVRRVLVLYTGPGETNEFALDTNRTFETWPHDSGITCNMIADMMVFQFSTTPERRSIELDGLTIHILSREDAYNYWVVDTDISAPIIKAGYLLRTATMQDLTLQLTGDINCTTTIEVIGAPHFTCLTFNNETIPFQDIGAGVYSGTVDFHQPDFSLPDLSTTLTWKSLTNALPEVIPLYNDSLWPVADLPYTNNTSIRNLTTPTSLYSSDYGFHCGSLIYRGHFNGTGNESEVYLETQGGAAFAHSIWLNRRFIGAFAGNASLSSYNETYRIPPNLTKTDEDNVLVVLIDHMGLEQNHDLGVDYPSTMKTPRGIMDYRLSGHAQSDVTWRLTGNLGGENYQDHSRGPLNEGGFYAERQGFHLPGTPTSNTSLWLQAHTGPSEGIAVPGLAFYTTTFNLSMPVGYDIPLAFEFPPIDKNSSQPYRCLLFVNGWQFGRYVSNVGPQTTFPVPEGILNYHGENYVAVQLWALGELGARIDPPLKIVTRAVVQSGYHLHQEVEVVDGMRWWEREGVY